MPKDSRERNLNQNDVTQVFADTIRHGRELMRAEFELAKAELTSEVRRAEGGILGMVVGTAIAGASIVLVTGALSVAIELDAWRVAGIGVGLGFAGTCVAAWGRRRLTRPRLDLTRRSLARSALLLTETPAESGEPERGT